jgi:hypothetical protein
MCSGLGLPTANCGKGFWAPSKGSHDLTVGNLVHVGHDMVIRSCRSSSGSRKVSYVVVGEGCRGEIENLAVVVGVRDRVILQAAPMRIYRTHTASVTYSDAEPRAA